MVSAMTDMHEGGNGSLISGAQDKINEMRDSAQEMMNAPQTRETLDRLRALFDQASQLMRDIGQQMRDIGQQSGEWTQAAQTRASEMARQLRDQSGVAVDSVSHQVERNPLTSIGIAFAVGFVCAALLVRR